MTCVTFVTNNEESEDMKNTALKLQKAICNCFFKNKVFGKALDVSGDLLGTSLGGSGGVLELSEGLLRMSWVLLGAS